MACGFHLRGHAQLECFQAAQQQPAGVRSSHGAEDGAQHFDLRQQFAASQADAGNDIAVPADIFGGGIEYQVGAVPERLLPERTQVRCCPRR